MKAFILSIFIGIMVKYFFPLFQFLTQIIFQYQNISSIICLWPNPFSINKLYINIKGTHEILISYYVKHLKFFKVIIALNEYFFVKVKKK